MHIKNIKFKSLLEQAEEKCKSCHWHGVEGTCDCPDYQKMLTEIHGNKNPECRYFKTMEVKQNE